jgi:hypothetical protein
MVGRYNNALNNGCTMTNYQKKKKKHQTLLGLQMQLHLEKTCPRYFSKTTSKFGVFYTLGTQKVNAAQKHVITYEQLLQDTIAKLFRTS